MVEMMAMMWIVNKDGDETYSQTVSDSQLTLRSGRLSNVWSLRFCRSKKTLQAFRNIYGFLELLLYVEVQHILQALKQN